MKKVNNDRAYGLKTLTVIYYSGHAMMKNGQSTIVCTDGPDMIAFEALVRQLSAIENSFVIAILDCCRENWTEKVKLKGGEEKEAKDAPDPRGNLIMIYRCPPMNKAHAQSTITTDFFNKVREATASNGCVLLPDDRGVFSSWVPNGKGEMLIKAHQ